MARSNWRKFWSRSISSPESSQCVVLVVRNHNSSLHAVPYRVHLLSSFSNKDLRELRQQLQFQLNIWGFFEWKTLQRKINRFFLTDFVCLSFLLSPGVLASGVDSIIRSNRRLITTLALYWTYEKANGKRNRLRTKSRERDKTKPGRMCYARKLCLCHANHSSPPTKPSV